FSHHSSPLLRSPLSSVFFNPPPTTHIYTLSLHDALPISCLIGEPGVGKTAVAEGLAIRIAQGRVPARLQDKEIYLLDLTALVARSEEHTSELQSRFDLVCRLLLEKKKKKQDKTKRRSIET